MSLSPPATDLAAVAAPLPSAASIAQLLASPKTSMRNRGVRLLSSYLPSLSPLPTPTTLLKIWKGLFFCFWHADRSLYQSSLATSIASLVSSNSPDLACLFLDAALVTLRREWANIDYLRMDKFYLLVRRIFSHTFVLLQGNSWDAELVGRVMGIVEERALGVEGTKGFSYHVVEIFLEELVKFLPVTKGTLEVLVAPFLRIFASSVDPILVHKVKIEIFMKLVLHGGRYLELKKGAGEVEKGSGIEKFGTICLTMGFSKRLLDLAKKEETVQENKKVLHELRDSFFKLEKDLEKSGIEISLPEAEIPSEVMKIEKGEGLGEQLPKKRKKKEKEPVGTKGKKSKEKKNKKKKMKTKENTENNFELEENTDSGTREDKENERGNENMINFDENVISNLQKQFEKAAAEAGMSAESKYETSNPLEATPVNPTKTTKKKKQTKRTGKLEMSSELELSTEDGNMGTDGENITSSVKKVRFSMKNNLEWKPSSPMPPQSLRIPPSATPRGSALKKGVPPGPVRDISSPVAMKRRKPKAKSAKKVPKGSKSPSMAVKRLRKLQSLSA